MYLIFRFLITTAQTKQFPTIHVMKTIEFTVVMAISADIDITVRYYSYLNEKEKNERINVWHEVLLVSNFFHYFLTIKR